MEKNHRFSNQSSSKGQLSESKKNQETSVKWPRHSKRREQPNTSGCTKPENYRNTSGKAATAGKTRNQTNYNYDKRSRQQRAEATGGLLPDAAASALESFDHQSEEQYDGTGLGLASSAPRHELHSVFAPGSKKQSLNHLLNFHYAPRERDQPARFSKTGNIRPHAMRKISYNKEQFLQANCQFVVRDGEEYGPFLASPDQLVDWSRIEQIHILSAEEPQCPICLYPPVAAKMTKCGHVYCWPCILHYLALSDKAWRKCPICYEAIHLPDLRSAVSKPFHSYAVGESVTFQLMRREKTSVCVVVAAGSSDGSSVESIPRFDPKSGNGILSKLLVANVDGILGIVDREHQELLNQIVVDGADCPENIFVQQALDQLEERKRDVSSRKLAKLVELRPAAVCEERATGEDPAGSSVTLDGDATREHNPTSQDFLIDEDSNFSLSDIDIVPTQQCAASNHFYFYQSTDGQPLYLHSLNTRMLQTMYGGLDKSPQQISGRIVHKDSCSLSEDLRRRLKYLQHLPVCTQFDVIEVEFEADVISADVLAQFKDEINKRKKDRQKRARAERIRERQIFEFNERQLGKSMARSAKIPIDSTKHFPSCGGAGNFDFSREPTLGTSPAATDQLTSPIATTSASSWSKMLSTSPAASRWPSLGGSGNNTFGPLATPHTPPRTVQVTGSNVTASATSQHRRFTSESDLEDGGLDDELEGARAPEFCNQLSFAIEAALEKATLNHEQPETSAKGKSKAVGGAAAAKKKKSKKTLLFASGINLN